MAVAAPLLAVIAILVSALAAASELRRVRRSREHLWSAELDLARGLSTFTEGAIEAYAAMPNGPSKGALRDALFGRPFDELRRLGHDVVVAEPASPESVAAVWFLRLDQFLVTYWPRDPSVARNRLAGAFVLDVSEPSNNPPARATGAEIEAVDKSVWGPLAPLNALLGPRAGSLVAALPPEAAGEIAYVLQEYSKLLDGEDRALVVELVRSRLTESLDQLTKEVLMFSVRFEVDLRSLLIDRLSRYPERDWSDLLEPDALGVGSRPRPSLRSLPPLALIRLAEGASGEHPDLRADLAALLGDAWPARIVEFFTDIRNPFVHGRTYDPGFQDRFLTHWRNYAVLLCETARLAQQIEATADRAGSA